MNPPSKSRWRKCALNYIANCESGNRAGTAGSAAKAARSQVIGTHELSAGRDKVLHETNECPAETPCEPSRTVSGHPSKPQIESCVDQRVHAAPRKSVRSH